MCLHEKTRIGASFIYIGMTFFYSYRVYMMTGSFHISLFEGTLHFDKIHVRFKIANITHDTVAIFRTEVKFSPR